MIRTMGQNGLDLVRNREGTVYVVYLDNVGHATGGTGHLIRESDHLNVGDPVSHEIEARWLQNDLAEACACVNRHCPDLPTQNAFDALVDFAFNAGCLTLQNMLADAGSLDAIPEQMQHYTRAGNTHPRGLRVRRLLEADLFKAPDGPMPDGWLRLHDAIV